MAEPGPWVVVVDVQRVFADPGSEWYAPGTAELVAPAAELAGLWAGRVVRTRFVPAPDPSGSWVDYYRRWPWALRPEAAAGWDLVDGLPAGADLDAPTFSKWGPELAALTGRTDLIVCGVATDCCVLATVLGALDAGRRVRVVADACAGSSAAAHDATLAVLAGFAPRVRVTTMAEERALAGGGR